MTIARSYTWAPCHSRAIGQENHGFHGYHYRLLFVTPDWSCPALGGLSLPLCHLAVVRCSRLRNRGCKNKSSTPQGSPRSFMAACHIASNLRIWCRANCENARSLSITEMQSQMETLWQTEPEVSVMAWWFESSSNSCSGEKQARTVARSKRGSGLKVSGTSARGALSVTAREMSCQSAIPRWWTRTFARARSGMHIITQAGVDSRHFFLTCLLSFSRPLQKAGSAWSSACSHLDDGQRRNLIVTYELLIFC